MVTRPVASWGRLSQAPHEVVALADRSRLRDTLAAGRRPALAYGNGRSYGDACLNPGGLLWSTRGLDRFVGFDAATGTLECEAGTTLQEITALSLPQGWFVPVTPGTQFVTVGGAIANDVHGKNHHSQGCFGEHVERLTLHRTDGSRIECAPDLEPDWFAATVGGLGLSGLIGTVRLRLRPVPGPWLGVETRTFDDLDGFFTLSAEAVGGPEYTVSWIDCGARRDGRTRGVFFTGRHVAATRPEPVARRRSLALAPPFSLVNRRTLSMFNALYFERHRRATRHRVAHYQSFFYPLDGVEGWNRLYGPGGFYQFQCVVPVPVQRDATAELLQAIGASRAGSFLAVLKTFGERPRALPLSFPMPGTTLALDFPNLGEPTRRLLARLEAITLAAGGRIYPAKDASMTATSFRAGYPAWSRYAAFRDPGISSALSRRLLGD